jgi:hypothetical protein
MPPRTPQIYRVILEFGEATRETFLVNSISERWAIKQAQRLAGRVSTVVEVALQGARR